MVIEEEVVVAVALGVVVEVAVVAVLVVEEVDKDLEVVAVVEASLFSSLLVQFIIQNSNLLNDH